MTAYQSYLVAEGRSSKTLSKYALVFRRVSALADRRKVRDLAGVDHAFVDAYKAERVEAGAAEKTHYGEIVVIRQLILFALSRKLIAADPLLGYKAKKPKPTRQPCWTRPEVDLILTASPDTIRPALTLLAESGMRFGEMAWLTWDDVNFELALLFVRGKEGWKPKTGDERAVPLSPALKALLNQLPRTGRWVVTMPGSDKHPRPDRQWTERRLLAALKKVLTGLNLTGKLHTFRHSFISNARLKGVPDLVVQRWAGHVDRAIMELYSHLNDTDSQAAMQRLSEANSQLQKKEELP